MKSELWKIRKLVCYIFYYVMFFRLINFKYLKKSFKVLATVHVPADLLLVHSRKYLTQKVHICAHCNLTCLWFIHQASWAVCLNLKSVQYNRALVLVWPLYKFNGLKFQNSTAKRWVMYRTPKVKRFEKSAQCRVAFLHVLCFQ